MTDQALRILHISTPTSWRGGERQAFLLAKTLHERGHFSLIMTPVGSTLESRSNAAGVPVETFKKTTAYSPLLASRVNKLCLKHDVDIIHAHDPNAHTMAWLSAVWFQHKTPILVSRRVDFVPKSKWMTRAKYNSRHITAYATVSDKIRSIIASYLTSVKELRTIHSGIDKSQYESGKTGVLRSELEISSEIKIVGNVAALADHKDHMTFVKVAKEVIDKRNDVAFVIIGEGDKRREIEQFIEQNNLRNKVFLLGYRTNVYELLPDFDIFLFTSKMEGLGTAVLDAFASGMPVIATDAGGISEMVKDEKSGLLCAVGDVSGIAEKTLSLLDNEMMSKTLLEGGKKVLSHFTIEATADKTLELYNWMLNTNR